MLNLHIKAEDSATEIFVISGELHLEARGLGELDTKPLPAGIYKIKTRTGGETREQYVVLRQPDQRVFIPRLDFVSPAPLEQTLSSHEYHERAAEIESKGIHLVVGNGSCIFIFSRQWSPQQSKAQSSRNPARGLCLRDASGEIVANLETASKTGDQDRDAWAACNIQLNPGVYRLSLDLPSGGRLEQAVVACAGWQTQIFLLSRSYGTDSDTTRADLASAAILMKQLGFGFTGGDPENRMTELARLGLANRRKILSSDVRAMFDSSFDNPMLGIYGGHLLLLDDQPNMSLLQKVIGALRHMVPGHPDVEALALKADLGVGTFKFSSPPMLRHSWTLIVDATVQQPDLVPIDSWAAHAAESLWSEEPWLLWTTEQPFAQEVSQMVIETLKSTMKPFGVRAARRVRSSESPFAAIRAMRANTSPSEPQGAQAEAFSSPSEPQVTQAEAFASSTEPRGAQAEAFIEPQVYTKDIGFLVRSLKIPRSNIERMVKTIADEDAAATPLDTKS